MGPLKVGATFVGVKWEGAHQMKVVRALLVEMII